MQCKLLLYIAELLWVQAAECWVSSFETWGGRWGMSFLCLNDNFALFMAGCEHYPTAELACVEEPGARVCFQSCDRMFLCISIDSSIKIRWSQIQIYLPATLFCYLAGFNNALVKRITYSLQQALTVLEQHCPSAGTTLPKSLHFLL